MSCLGLPVEEHSAHHGTDQEEGEDEMTPGDSACSWRSFRDRVGREGRSWRRTCSNWWNDMGRVAGCSLVPLKDRSAIIYFIPKSDGSYS